MPSSKLDWQNNTLAAGRGATLQQFVATLGNDKFEIDVAPWGEGHFKVNGRQVARVDDAKDRRQAFRQLKQIAEDYVAEQANKSDGKKPSRLPVVKAKLIEGKRGLIVCIHNDQAIT